MNKNFRKRKIYHRPFLWIAILFSFGIVFDHFFFATLSVIFFLLFVSTFLGVWFLSLPRISTSFLLASIILLGLLCSFSHQILPKDHIRYVAKYYRGKPVEVEGVVVSDVEERNFFKGKKTSFILDVKRLNTQWGWKEISGKVLVNIFRDENVFYGDYLLLEGKLHKPFEFSKDGTFSYQDYLGRKGIGYIFSVKKIGHVEVKESHSGNPIKAFSLELKHQLKKTLEENLTPKEASIVQAVLLGDRYNIPKNIKELFQISGVAHILAISGIHQGIVGGLIFLFLKILPIPRKGQYFLTICLLVFYSFLTGGRPSVIRATIMSVVFLTSFIVEKEGDLLNTLGLAAFILLLINPLNLFDVGFQLSFTSVFSIVSLYPIFMSGWKRLLPDNQSRIINHFMQSLSVSLSAYLGVIGLIAYYFRIITPIAIFANLVVVPLIAVVIALGLGLLLVCQFPLLASAFAMCLKVTLNIMVAFIFLCVQMPGAYFLFEKMSLGIVATYYLCLILSTWGLNLILRKYFVKAESITC